MSNAFEGLREMLANPQPASTSRPLTMQDIKGALEYLGSEEYATLQREAYIQVQEAFAFLDKAFAQGIISQAEYAALYESVSINNGLIVSPRMAERLKQVKE